MDPKAEYRTRLAARQAEVARLGQRDRALSTARLGMFVVVCLVLYLGLGPHLLPAAWAAVPAAAFILLVVLHDCALGARRRAERAVAHYERAMARVEDRWAGHGEEGLRFDAPDHPYARDLDLFGKGSLFELLCTTRTLAGEETLARWLKTPATIADVRERQAAVEELRGRLDLREALAILGSDVRAEVDPSQLAAWATQPPQLAKLRWMRPLLPIVAAGALVALAGWLGLDFGWSPLVGVLGLIWIIGNPLKKPVEAVGGAVNKPGQHLAVLAVVLERLERERFASPRLQALQAELAADGKPASQQIARLGRLINFLLAQQNQLFAPLAYMLLWAPQFAFAIEGWRMRSGPRIAGWLAAVGELEALCALGGYAFEHPQDPFPELVEGARFEGEGLGHPLIAEAACVRNDVHLGGELRLLLVSGSNMSGKSTLLRTVGTSVVLALAGAPVRARKLTLSPLQIGATLRVQDSLQEGASRFYAEITRLRQVVDLAQGTVPLLFLLDEILHGTNSHDRRLGAEAVVRGLVERGALGLVTTHDLALAEMVSGLGTRATNVHFEDHLEGGKLTFDYTMRPGIVKKSNALELMRAVGLQV